MKVLRKDLDSRQAEKIPQDRHQSCLRALCCWESLIQSQFQKGGEEKEQAYQPHHCLCYPRVYGDPTKSGLADSHRRLSDLTREL